MKHLLARWLAARAEASARVTRRELRDYTRRELRRAEAADRRARGLRIYAAWISTEDQERPARAGSRIPALQMSPSL